MTESVYGVNGNIPIRPAENSSVPVRPQETGRKPSFGQILGDEISRHGELKFSVHAQERLRLRNIRMGAQDIERLKQAVDRVAERGGRESLVLTPHTAFLVSVSNRTVITAIGSENLKDKLFTNIDSAVIV